MSITNLQISDAKKYAKLLDPTDYEKVQLVKIYSLGYNSRNPSINYQIIRKVKEEHPIIFNDWLEEARNHFKDKTKIE